MAEEMTHEREITGDVDLCLSDGRVTREARGFSRVPLHRCNLNGPWGRQKRWDYWAVANERCALSLTYADVDYLGLVAIAFFDFEKQRATVERGTARPFARGFAQGDRAGIGDVAFAGSGITLRMRQDARGAHLQAECKGLTADVTVAREDDESLNVVVPWSERRFQYTSKQVGLRARGTVSAHGQRFDLDPAFAALDYGRGVWPYAVTWNWACAAGVEHGRRIGLQFGGKWTDGTGFTENGVFVDGRLRKIGEDVRFDRSMETWTIRSPSVDLRFVPILKHRVRAPLLVASAALDLRFGHFSGIAADVRVERLLGWAEDFRGRW
jgi:hypothetical protein